MSKITFPAGTHVISGTLLIDGGVSCIIEGTTLEAFEDDIRQLSSHRRNDKVFDLVKADMDRAEDEMRAILARAMFPPSEPPLFSMFYAQPDPWWVRRARRVRWYLVNLWDALLGRVHDVDDDDAY